MSGMLTERNTCSAGRSSAEQMAARVTEDLLGRGGGARPGAALLAALRCLSEGRSIQGDLLGALSRLLGVGAAELAAVARFAQGLLEGREAVPCWGTSCCMNGAAEQQARVEEELRRQGVEPRMQRVYCLGYCDCGPNMMVGGEVFCGGDQSVVREERHWREDAGPVSLEGDSRPQRD